MSSEHDAKPSETPTSIERGAEFDMLLDEMDITSSMLGRLIAARHSGQPREGLTMPQMLALRLLVEFGAVKSGDMSHYLGIKAPATTTLIDGLEQEGYVSREHDDTDRRVTRIQITDDGRAALREAERCRREHMRRYMQVLSDEDMRAAIRIQRRLIEVLTRGEI